MVTKSENWLEELVISNVQRIRTEKGITIEQAASSVGMNKIYYGDLLRGKRRISVRNLHRLAESLEVEPIELLVERKPRHSK